MIQVLCFYENILIRISGESLYKLFRFRNSIWNLRDLVSNPFSRAETCLAYSRNIEEADVVEQGEGWVLQEVGLESWVWEDHVDLENHCKDFGFNLLRREAIGEFEQRP